MKFKMGSSKDDTKTGTRGSGLHDATSTSTASRGATGTGSNSASGVNSNSGIYDVSRMTNIKSPVDPFGHNVSHFTKVRAADDEIRAQKKTEIVRGVLATLAVPMIAGAAYLAFSGQSLHIPGLTSDPEATKTSKSSLAKSDANVDRKPAAKASLPAILPLETAPTAPAITTVGQDAHRTINQAVEPQPLKLELDSSGMLVSPYSVELNENGEEVARTELRDQMVFLPTLPLGPFENAPVLSKAEVPSTFVNDALPRPFVFTDDERRRIGGLRAVAPEVKKYLDDSDSTSSARLSTETQSVESFAAAPNLPQSRIDDMYLELKWMRAASLARDLSGDRTVERRLMDSLMNLARTYKPTGAALSEIPLLDAVFAYDHVRHLWSTPNQAIIDGFFRDVVDLQFTRMKSEKVYSDFHAAHVLFALSVGYVIQNTAFELHGITQYKLHIERSKMFAQDSFGPEDVRTLNFLFRSAYVLDRAGSFVYQNAKLNQAISTLYTASQAESKIYLLKTLGYATYFRPELYPLLAQATRTAGVANSRFGSGEGALIAASRRPTASLVPSAVNRLPTSAPLKLPAKRK